jgi:adenylate cyclase
MQKRLRNQSRRIGAFIAIAVASFVLSISQLGGLEIVEIRSYDSFLQMLPKESPDSRVVIVTISDSDIETLHQYPIYDETLATVLEKLESYKPRAIGLDIARDVPFGPIVGRKHLGEVIRKSEVIVSGCLLSTVARPGSPPAPETPDGAVGFSDVYLDIDQTVRRIPLISTPAKSKKIFLFNIFVIMSKRITKFHL